ncbi:MAG: FAD:protein FMN transferase [Firmicutes bacterium]|nr:FAD:protein FMN transferase [Bacillota bacterium]
MEVERREAMGTWVRVVVPQGADAAPAWEVFAEWEAVLSRFRADSELSYLNARAGRPVRVSRLLYTVAERALAAAAATGGLYDPTVLRALEAAGYDRTFAALEARASAAPAPAPRPFLGTWRRVRLDPAASTVHLPPGVGLDFGGIAKGMAVDSALGALEERGVRCALVEAGGDLGVRGRPPGLAAWRVAVPTPLRTYVVQLERGALATSGIGRRRWRRGRTWAHHLLDPRTGAPAVTGLWSVTAAAPDATRAEVAAKAAFLLGAAAGGRWLEERRLAGLFVGVDGGVTTAGRWPREMEVWA